MPRFDLTPRAGEVWRFVEAQHRVSTMKLVDSLADQALLEDLLDASKPPVPAECRGLDWLLYTPFRYAARRASRYRREGEPRGVFYAAERVETAAAEMAYYRRLFFLESPATILPEGAQEMTAFSVGYAAQAVDLSLPPWRSDAALNHLSDYTACHQAAEEAREIGATAILYRSVRDPDAGTNLAILRCEAFTDRAPRARETWRFRLTPDRVMAWGETRGQRLEFPYAGFGE